MEYKFIDEVNTEETKLPDSKKINPFLLKNNYDEIVKALDFFASEAKFLYIHGFLGTGKRQFLDYLTDFFNKEVIKLEYHCKPSTVCDDILLSFIDIIEKISLSKAVVQTAKITTLAVKLQQYISSIKKPFVIILHSYDDIEEANRPLVADVIKNLLDNSNVKVVLSTRAMIQDVLGDIKYDKKIILKGFSKEIFSEFIKSYKIKATDEAINDFYKYSRGYYYYTALTIKIIQAMNISLNEFLAKLSMSGMSFDSFLGFTYLNLIPNTIRNFFWFLCSIRHGISLNALAIWELYDDFSVSYLKNNLMIYLADEVIYVQDYFQQDIDISIPTKTEIRLHKYIIGIYEKELKEPLQTREITISRQALRAEIEYHKKRIYELENNVKLEKIIPEETANQPQKTEEKLTTEENNSINGKMSAAKKLAEEKKFTDAIESYLNITNEPGINNDTLAEARVELARLYMKINDFAKSRHYYELAETYYKKNEEFINLNYLYYELTDLYYAMYKTERAVETIKKVIYSVDTPQSLLVDACTLLGNILSDNKDYNEAYKYYIKALESIDKNTPDEKKSELYFKLALACDENEDEKNAFEYYNKCIQTDCDNSYKGVAYSNLGACYYENENYSDALDCFLKAYNIEKAKNNFEGIYYAASYLAKIYTANNPEKVLDFLLEAKQCAEFINENFYILEATIALGDYYYNNKTSTLKAVTEYLNARKIARDFGGSVDIKKIQERIDDMKLRMDENEFKAIEQKYE